MSGEVPADYDLPVTDMEMIAMASSAGLLEIRGQYRRFYIQSVEALSGVIRSLLPNSLGMLLGERGSTIPDHMVFGGGQVKFETPACVIILIGDFMYQQTPSSRIILVEGAPAACAMVRSKLEGDPRITSLTEVVGLSDHYPTFQPATRLVQIKTKEIVAYHTNEAGLYDLLRTEGISKVSKIISSFLTLFPYIKTQLPPSISVMDYRFVPQEGTTVDDILGLGGQEDYEGGTLALLGLHILGPAYSSADRFRDQIVRRLRAIAATLQVSAPDNTAMSHVITESSWTHGDLPPLINEVLGIAICQIATAGAIPDAGIRHNPDATAAGLASVELLKTTYALSDVAAELLNQARLVYANHHSTSIHFIPAMMEALRASGMDTAPLLVAEVAAYTTVETQIRESMYIGLRQILPVQYQIKTFPKLVYGALLYHRRSLTNDNDLAMFDEYKISEIKNHINTKADQNFVEHMVVSLSPPSVRALVTLMKVLPKEKAEAILASKTEDVRLEIIASLRSERDKGEWMTDLIDRENAQCQIDLVNEATVLLKSFLEDKYRMLREMAIEIQNVVDRQAETARIIEWKRLREEAIMALLPLESRLSKVWYAVQEAFRTQLINQMRLIQNSIAAARPGGPEPMQH